MGRPVSAAALCVIVLLVGVLLCLGAYALVEFGLNDAFTAWFTRTCMRQEFVNVNGAGLMYSYRVVDWDAVRAVARAALCGAVALGFAAAAVLCLVSYRVASRRTLMRTEAVMDDVMGRHDVRVERYPRRFAPVVARMVELKDAVRQRERVIQDETDRKNELVTYLAHDLKTPLASVVGYLSLLCEAPDMPDDQRAKCLGTTLSKAMQLENLIEEFFDIARYSLQQIELDKVEVDLDFMLVQLVDEFQPLFARHGNTASVSCEEGLTVYADPDRLARVFNNILKNAIAYSYEGTPVDIGVLRDAGTVFVQITSRGDTIPRQKLDLVFEKFYRVDEARSGKTGGAGLGLAIAKEIVTLHGGQISATSDGGVTTFTVALPA